MWLVLFQEMGAALTRALDGLLVLPGADQLGIAAQEDVGDFPAVVFGRAGVDRGSDEAFLEAVAEGRGLIGQGAGDEADDRIGEKGRRNLAAADDEVADGDLAGHEVLADTFVDAFVVAAEEDEVLLEGKLVGDGLGEGLTVGGEVDDLVVGALGGELLYHFEDGLHHHDHAGIAAIAVVVDRLAGAETVFADVVDADVDEAFLDGAADY